MKRTTLAVLLEKFHLTEPLPKAMPVEVPNVGRDDLARIFGEFGFRHGVEVGVKEGDYSKVLLEHNRRLHLKSIDPWLVRDGYRDKRSQAIFDGYEAKAREVLGAFGARSEIVKGFSVDVARSLPNASQDFVYIDGHHSFQAATNDIAEWLPKIKPGGILAGHDYAVYKQVSGDNMGKYVVDAYTAAYKIRPWFVLGRKAMVPGEVRDKHRSWCWVV